MTLPTLIQNHEKRVIETGLAKSYSDINNWLTRSELDNDSRTYWDYTLPTDEFVKKYFAPYVTLKECTYSTQGKCFKKENSTTINSWSYVNGNSPNGQIRMTSRKYLLPDGRAIAFMVSPGSPSYAKYEPYLGIWIDVNGPRGNSILGKDVYQMIMFNYAKWGQNMIGKPTFGGYWGYFGYSGVDHASLSDSENYAACERDNEVCGILLQRNGWKFPKDYPIKF